MSVLKQARFALEYAALRSFVSLFSPFKRTHALALGRRLGNGLFLTGLRRRVIRDNLAIAFPEMSPDERLAIARRCLAHFGHVLIELSDIHKWSDEKLRDITSYDDLEILQNAVAEKRGVVLATGHIGGFDVGPARLQLDGFRVTSVYQKVHNPHAEAFLTRIRTLRGAHIAQRGMGMRLALDALGRRETVIILADQDAGPKGLFLPFFSRSASTLRGPAELALRTGAILMTGFAIRDGDRYRLITDPPIPHSTVEEMMLEYNRRLEAVIRRYPEQYFWLHRRWKSQPPS